MENGQGFRRIIDVVKAYDYKMWWKFRSGEGIWAKFIWTLHPNKRRKTSLSRVLHIEEDATKQTKSIIRSGNSSFWNDNWAIDIPLSTIASGPLILPELTVRDFVLDRTTLVNIASVLPTWVMPILEEFDITITQDLDELRWMATSSGIFTLKSAYQRIRAKGESKDFFNFVWHKWLPTKVSFFMWKLINFYLPFPDILRRFQLHLPSRCCFCANDSDDMFHAFYTCPFINSVWRELWRNFGLGINLPRTLVDVLEICWAKAQKKSVLHDIQSILPSVLLWEIWKSRNGFLFENTSPSATIILSNTKQFIADLLRVRTPLVNTAVEAQLLHELTGVLLVRKTRRSPLILTWEPPARNFLKLNVDGAYSRSERRKSGGGYIIRDEKGDMLEAGAIPLSGNDAFQTELLILNHGLRRCIQQSHTLVEINCDNKLLVLLCTTNMQVPWRHVYLIEAIRQLLTCHGIQLRHVYREVNSVADALAKEGMDLSSPTIFHSLSCTPRKVKGCIILDKLGVPYIRTVD